MSINQQQADQKKNKTIVERKSGKFSVLKSEHIKIKVFLEILFFFPILLSGLQHLLTSWFSTLLCHHQDQ